MGSFGCIPIVYGSMNGVAFMVCLVMAAIVLTPRVNVMSFALCCLPVAHHIARGLFEGIDGCPILARVLGYVPSLSTLCI